ncbi:MAG: FkbM family methyltransferase [Planctomycetaceae bacterium]|nr:FkbM family methyltransferase [Planctomycetaceae bacterium]
MEKCGDFKITEIEGVRVAQGKEFNFGYILGGDGILMGDGMLIVEEIFKKGEYNFELDGEAVVIDIGMNIGLASLYFAGMNNVSDVYGFEPFKPTFEQAMFNFKINEKYAGKIHPNNYGLGDEDKELVLEYCPLAPGRMSTVKPITEIYRSGRKYETKTETIQIRDTAKCILPIIERHKDKKIAIKCDTEGSEKEIFNALESKGLLESIDVIMLEYHFSYDAALLEMFKRNGFISFKHKTVSMETGDAGMIRSVRNK